DYVPRASPDGRADGYYVLIQDITERKKAERSLTELTATLEQRVRETVAEREAALAQLGEMQKMETIGQLSGGIAHDFNNLLTPIVGSLDMLYRKYQDDERSVRMLSGALQAAERARVLVSRLLTFARRQHLEAQPVNVGSLTEGMFDLIQRTIGPQVKISIDIADDVPPAHVDPHQLELALLNMCVNARDAMPGGGNLTIAGDVVEGKDGTLPNLPDSSFVRLCVIDTGHGMDAETLRRSTEPFYSTKGVGKGTGLGLSMVQGLAVQSGGGLHITSAPGEGTTVTIWLPVTDGAASSANVRPGFEEISSTRSLSVLLVDDEELVLQGNAEMLESLGHCVML
ncbi:MAG: ATP-binding protein, partial [Gammaproteobacteria bacterium]